MANIEEKVENLIKQKVEDLGYSIYDVQYVKEGQEHYLRVFIEKENGGIDLNDCEKVNDGITDLLDEADYIKEQYYLEISSTGIEKMLRKNKHLQDNIGNEIHINMFKPIEIQDNNKSNQKQSKKNAQKDRFKEVQGILKEFNEKEIIIELENKQTVNIERSNISLIKTVFDWDSM